MTYLKWEGMDCWNDVDPSIQEAYIPTVMTWILYHIKYLPDWPEKNGITPKKAVEDFFTENKIKHGWNQQQMKMAGFVALSALYKLEMEIGIFKHER